MEESENTKLLREIRSPNLKASFINGIFSGVGIVIGSTVVIALAVLILRQFITVPIIGEMINDIIEVVESRRPQSDSDVEKLDDSRNNDNNQYVSN